MAHKKSVNHNYLPNYIDYFIKEQERQGPNSTFTGELQILLPIKIISCSLIIIPLSLTMFFINHGLRKINS